eukprot:SAG11_NODE_97_length_16960_cov_22.407405_1_plen_256_part_00
MPWTAADDEQTNRQGDTRERRGAATDGESMRRWEARAPCLLPISGAKAGRGEEDRGGYRAARTPGRPEHRARTSPRRPRLCGGNGHAPGRTTQPAQARPRMALHARRVDAVATSAAHATWRQSALAPAELYAREASDHTSRAPRRTTARGGGGRARSRPHDRCAARSTDAPAVRRRGRCGLRHASRRPYDAVSHVGRAEAREPREHGILRAVHERHPSRRPRALRARAAMASAPRQPTSELTIGLLKLLTGTEES